MIKAIIFDLDGVLVLGNNKFHVKAWDKSFKEFGLDINVISEKYYNELEGMKGSEIGQIILKENHKKIPLDLFERIYKRKKDIFKEIVQPEIPDGIISLLISLKKQGVKLAIASGANTKDVLNFLDVFYKDIFNIVIGGDDVARGKPYPDLYLKVLHQLKLSADECIVVENTPLGIASAKAAGIFTVAITSTLPKEDLENADRIISSLQEISTILSDLK